MIPNLRTKSFPLRSSSRKVFPELAESIRRRQSPQKEPTKVAVSIRLSQDVLAYYKAQSPQWQSRIDADLRAIVARKRKASRYTQA